MPCSHIECKYLRVDFCRAYQFISHEPPKWSVASRTPQQHSSRPAPRSRLMSRYATTSAAAPWPLFLRRCARSAPGSANRPGKKPSSYHQSCNRPTWSATRSWRKWPNWKASWRCCVKCRQNLTACSRASGSCGMRRCRCASR